MPQYFYHIGIELIGPKLSLPVNVTQVSHALQPFTSVRPLSMRASKYSLTKPTSSVRIADHIVASSPEDKRIDEIVIEPSQMDDITTGIGTTIASVRTKAFFTEVEGERGREEGIIHLYRDAEETPELYIQDRKIPSSELAWNGSAPVKISSSDKTLTPAKDDECTIVSILAVPSYLTPKDFLAFVGQDTRNAVSHFRMIKTSRLNRYMVLMKFKDGRFARQWQHDWNGKVFNTMEPETCHVVFVKSVEVMHNEDLLAKRDGPAVAERDTILSSDLDKNVNHRAPLPPLTKPIPPPTPSLVELPTCPVCLERMDESTGLLTILCQHVFHCSCLEKWSGGGCPVCRYTHDDFSTSVANSRAKKSKKRLNSRGEYDVEDEQLECAECQITQTLWQCLICGLVGCGRYAQKHAYRHYEKTGHTFALDLESQRVWDYDHDCYVHRIIANGSSLSGEKLVEIPGRGRDGQTTALEDMDHDLDVAKRENLAFEYTQLLTSQLESQRVYFEEVLARAADKAADASKRADRAALEVVEVQNRLNATLRSTEELDEKLRDLERQMVRTQTRSLQLQESNKTLKDGKAELESLAAGYSEKITALEKVAATNKSRFFQEQEARLKTLEEECATKDFFIEALQEERSDLRIQLDAETQLFNLVKTGQLSLEELKGATVEVRPSGASSSGKTGKSNSKASKTASAPKIAGAQETQKSEPTDEQVEEQIKSAAAEREKATEAKEFQQELQKLFGQAYNVNATITMEQITHALLETGIIEHKEEDGLYDGDSGEVSQDEESKVKADAKRKANRKKRNKKKK